MTDDTPLESLTLAQLRACIRRGKEAEALLREAVGEAPAAVAAPVVQVVRAVAAPPPGLPPLSPSEMAERNHLLAKLRPDPNLPDDIRAMEEAS